MRREIRSYIRMLGDLPMVEVELFRDGQREVERLQGEYVRLHYRLKAFVKSREVQGGDGGEVKE